MVFAEETKGILAYFLTDWYFYTNFNLSMVFFLLVNYSFYWLLASLDRSLWEYFHLWKN